MYEMKRSRQWIYVIACMLLLAVSLGIFSNTNSVFVKPVCEELRLDRGPYTFYRTIILLLAAATTPFYAWLISKVGIRRVFLVGAIVQGLSFLGYSVCTKLWHVYFFAVVQGMAYSSINFMSVGLLVHTVFSEREGLALGIAYAGSGMGGVVTVPVISRIIETKGWRTAYRIAGVAGVIIMVVLILGLVQEPPGLMKEKESSARQKKITKEDRTSLLMLPQIWYVSIAFFLIGMIASSATTHTAAYLSDIGYSPATAASIVSIFLTGMTVGKILLGLMYDRSGVPLGNAFVIICGIAGSVMFILARSVMIAYIAALLTGFLGCAVSVSLQVSCKRYFTQEQFTSAFSIVTMIATFGTAFAVPASGFVYDVARSYRPAYVVFCIFGCLSGTLLFMTEVRKRSAGN